MGGGGYRALGLWDCWALGFSDCGALGFRGSGFRLLVGHPDFSHAPNLKDQRTL